MDIKEMRAVDSEAANIYQDVQNAAKSIMQRRAELDAQGLQDTTLFVAVGETHHCSAHLLHNSLLIRALAEYDEPIACAVEQPYNELNAVLDKDKAHEMTWREYGYKSIEHALLNKSGMNADLANMFFFKTLLNHCDELDNFSAIFNDAATKNNALDLEDKETLEIFSAFFKADDAKQPVHALSAEGTFIRNVFMADQIKSFADNQKARIALQFCGQGHITGNEFWNVENSLAGCFNQMSVPFMALYMPHDGIAANIEALPDELKILSSNVPYMTTMYQPSTGVLDPECLEDKKILDEVKPDITSRVAEQEYLNTKLRNMGLADQQLHFKLKS